MALIIREAQEEDRPAILKIVEAAFAQADEAAIVEKLWEADAISLDLVAEADGEIVGHCAFSPVTADPALKGGLLGMAPVSVAPAHQNRGVGSAMIETGIDYCRTRGASLLVVLGEPS
ncbi:MAG TPA: N-acetyltransferase, partial [Parvularculaceae bacterium]|nr:N-acetyltransferase [Parvularculaceae bacterium]